MATKRTNRKNETPTASRVLFRRFYEGDAQRIAEYEQTRREMALGDKIRALREARGLTQAQLADLVGTGPSAISRIEAADYGRHNISTLKRVAAALGCHLEVNIVPDDNAVTA